MLGDFTRVRHLRIIVGMMIVMYLVDTLVEYQFQAMARTTYRGDQLTAYFGQFYGLWLNGVEFVFQLFLTGVIVRWFGIGATLQISPIAVGLSSDCHPGRPWRGVGECGTPHGSLDTLYAEQNRHGTALHAAAVGPAKPHQSIHRY